MKFSSLSILILCCFLAGCASQLKTASNDARASMSPEMLEANTVLTYPAQERSPSVRAAALQAIQESMLKTGRYRKQHIEDAELVSLTPAPHAAPHSSWNHNAVVRMDFGTHSLDIGFMVYERDGILKVRKTSL